jgi:hypothetical protein
VIFSNEVASYDTLIKGESNLGTMSSQTVPYFKEGMNYTCKALILGMNDANRTWENKYAS